MLQRKVALCTTATKKLENATAGERVRRPSARFGQVNLQNLVVVCA